MIRATILFLLLSALVAAAYGCSSTAHSAEKASDSSTDDERVASENEVAPANVKVAPATPGTLVEYVEANGITTPKADVTYSAEVPGRIEHLKLDLGDKVRKGQVLARIDYTMISAEKEQAEANNDLAQLTYGRLEQLKNEELVSAQQIDEARSNLLQSKARLKIIDANLAKSTIKSSLNGIVTGKFADQGEYAAPGAPLFRVIDYKTIVVEAQLAESQVSGVVAGTSVEVTIDALGQMFTGEVDTVVPTADPQAKTFTLRVNVDNPDLKIMVGMATKVSIAARNHENVIITDQDTVLEDGESRSVFVAHEGIAKRRTVRLGATQDDKVIVLDGVTPGEQLIVVGQRDLVDGQPIRIVR